MIDFSVTKNGKPLDKSLYDWNEKTKTFSSNVDSLVLDFTGVVYVTFKTGDNCTFRTGSYCTFKTGYYCTFNTDSYCTFNTGSHCTFKTKDRCNFITYQNCSFNVGEQCVLVRRDIHDIIQLPTNKILKLNAHQIKGFTLLDKQVS